MDQTAGRNAPNLILIGLMGAGKSTVGALVAERLGMTLTDTDRLVEQVAGRPVAEIFAREGEAGFRRREAEAVALVCGRGGQVVATGGGAVLDPLNRERLWRCGLVVWLDAPPEVLAGRLPQPHSRPLLSAAAAPEKSAGAAAAHKAAVTGKLQDLLTTRGSLYAAAHYRVDTAGRAPAQVAEEVARLYRDWRASQAVRFVPVSLGERSYRIAIGAGLLGKAGVYMRQALGLTTSGPLPKALVVTSETVGRLWLEPLTQSLTAEGFTVHPLEVPDGDEAKTLAVLARAYDACAAAELDRRAVVVALGGGAVGDLAGLAAATYLRGLAFVQVPTTLLAQVDASVGGKVAVNHPRGKNLIGAFHQPRLVLADPLTLASLPDRELRAGLAEVIKHGVIADPAYLRQVGDRLDAVLAKDPEALAEVVEGSCRIKASVVEADEHEAGPRANLNYGHTAGHGLEAAAGFGGQPHDQATVGGLLHGEAVALGMLVAARLGAARSWAPGLEVELERLFSRIGLPTRVPELPLERVMAYMQADKKAAGGRLTWVLARDAGQVARVQDIDLADVERILIDLGG